MSRHRCDELSDEHFEVQRDLISRVHGKEQAEEYFNSIQIKRSKSSVPTVPLKSRISNERDPSILMPLILDHLIEIGLTFELSELHNLTKKLRRWQRSDQALQISEWMSRHRGDELSAEHFAFRLQLVLEVHGLEQAEEYFNSMPDTSKSYRVCSVLLLGYVNCKQFDKVDLLMHKMRDMPFTLTAYAFVDILNHYAKERKYVKLFLVGQEITWQAYAASGDIEKMQEFLSFYAHKWNNAKQLLGLYAAKGNNAEVYCVWNLYEQYSRYCVTPFVSSIPSLVKLNNNDVDGAEEIVQGSVFPNLEFDIWVPKWMIRAYSRNGCWEKAEEYINQIIKRGKGPDAAAWKATRYLLGGRKLEAVETLKKGTSKPGRRPPPSPPSYFGYMCEVLGRSRRQ